MDPVALRRINLMRDGATTHTRQQLDRVLAVECLDAAIKAAGWEPGVPYRQGQGTSQRSDFNYEGSRKSYLIGGRTQPSPPKLTVHAHMSQVAVVDQYSDAGDMT